MKSLWLTLLLFIAGSSSYAQIDALDSALSVIGESRSDFHVDAQALRNRDFGRLKLPIFEQWFDQPLRIPTYERYLRNALLESEGRLHAVWLGSASAISMVTRRDLIPPSPLQRYSEKAALDGSLRTAMLSLDSNAVVPDLSPVPKTVQTAAAMIIYSLIDAVQWREMALREIPPEKRAVLYQSLIQPIEWPARDSLLVPKVEFPEEYRKFYDQIDLLEKLDFPLLSASCDDITAVLDSVRGLLDTIPPSESFSVRIPTRLGEVILSGGQDNHYSKGPHPLLIVDLSGDDVYETGGASGGAELPFGIIVDIAGNDHYESDSRVPSFGTGVLGVGAVIDAAGNDTYHSAHFYAQGCGLAGCGLLLDGAGNDSYEAFGGSQGLGYFGIGILTDLSGDDRYLCYNISQGCGMTRGMGLLLDLAGGDRYEANDTDLQFVSAQSKDHNSSMSQGVGFGLRRDYLDGHSLAGGVGMLLDAAGDDHYSGGVFSQAVGYWYAIGILDDRSGNDTYRSVWYGQSATAHFAVSYLNDGGGDDTYTSLMTMAVGAAHDFSASVFLEEGGNDSYQLKGNCLGRSLNSSVALFVDAAGNDRYQGSDGMGLSQNSTLKGFRAEMPTLGIFLDLGGSDIYPDSTRHDNSVWIQPPTSPLPILKGIGMDRSGMSLKWE
jgi:hypothetical protein